MQIPFMTVIKAYGDSSVELTVGEHALLFRLFLINNKAGWTGWFGATNRRLLLETGIKSEKTLISTRNSLKQKGLIDFIPGKKGQPTSYTLSTVLNTVNNTVENKYTVIDTVNNTGNTTVKTTVKTTDIIDTKVSMTNRLETKDKKKSAAHSKKKPAFSPPTLAEVQDYVREKKLPIDPVRFFDYYDAGNWHDGKQKPVKNWKQKAITWAKHDDGSYQRNNPAFMSKDTKKMVMGGL